MAMVVEGVLMVVSVVLLGVYNFWLLRRVKKFESGHYGRGRKEWEGRERGKVQEAGMECAASCTGEYRVDGECRRLGQIGVEWECILT